jgi:hypothetical protein
LETEVLKGNRSPQVAPAPPESPPPSATWAATRPLPTSHPSPTTFPPCCRWRGRPAGSSPLGGSIAPGRRSGAARPRPRRRLGAGSGVPAAGSGFPRAGSVARGRGGPEGGVDNLAEAPARGAQILRPLARIRRPPTVGSTTGGCGGISCGRGGFWRRSGVDGSGLPACARGSFFVRHLATLGGRCGAMVARPRPQRGTMVVQRPSALLREVRRRGGVSFCNCGGRRMVRPTAGQATSGGSAGGNRCYGRRVAWAWGGGREAELSG